MFAKIAFAAAAAQILPIVIPLQKAPRQVERAIAPIETAGPQFAAACKDWDQYDKPAPPVRIFGNTYLVGTCGVSAVLITGSDGDILIDGGPERAASLIAANIRSLGYRLTYIKFLLHSHEHFDHVGGIAELQRMTRAQLVASPGAAVVLNSGTASNDDPQFGLNPPFAAAHVDKIVRDGEQIRLGNLVVTGFATPGHTPGAMTWQWGSCQSGVCRQIVYADSLTPVSNDKYRFSDHPTYLAAYRASIAKIASLECDILLTPHPAASQMIDRLAGRQPLENDHACRDYSVQVGKQLDDRVAKEKSSQ
jgi:metallo-beta-lactamase class B